MVMAILQSFIPNQGEAWAYTLDAVRGYLERVLAKRQEIQHELETLASLLDIEFETVPPLGQELIGGVYFETARPLGKRTGELHLALSSVSGDSGFSPEPFSMLYQRSVYQTVRSLARQVLQPLRKDPERLPEGIQKIHLLSLILSRKY